MNINRLTIEESLYILAFAFALGVRFLGLGVAPLSDYEAGWAIQALQVSRGEQVILGPAPGYVLLTGLIFFLFGAADGLARFWPALAGSLLIWLPFIFRRQIGQKAALVAAFGLALDPGLVTLSRLAGGPMLALSFGLLALGLAYSRRPVWAGVTGGLALLGGTAVWQGAAGLALAFGALKLAERLRIVESSWEHEASLDFSKEVRAVVITGGGILLLAGTLFLVVPQGLGAFAEAVPAYLSGWLQPSGVPATRLLAAMLFYQPLALIFGLAASVRGWVSGGPLPRWLSLWFVAALLAALFYPGRQVADIAWALVPIWLLAGLELARQLHAHEWERLPALGQAALIFFMLALAWINLAGLSHGVVDMQVYRLRWAVIGGTLALGAVTTVLVSLGWSPVVAQRGLSWGVGLAMGFFVLAALWGGSQSGSRGELDLWVPPPVTRQADLLLATLGDLADINNGRRDTLDLAVLSPTPSLEWSLREWRQARILTALGPGELPEAIIAPADLAAPGVAMAYRGQDFVWSVYPDWEGALPLDWPRWLVFRDAPQRTDEVILWARGDIFLDGSLLPSDQQPAPADEEDFIPGDGSIQ